jgi:lipid II:glycine glycyltransferase (peptidoglycan interpeptide bridge formation enzyme)
VIRIQSLENGELFLSMRLKDTWGEELEEYLMQKDMEICDIKHNYYRMYRL